MKVQAMAYKKMLHVKTSENIKHEIFPGDEKKKQ